MNQESDAASTTNNSVPANIGPNAFAGTAEDYARFRRPYPTALLARAIELSPGRNRLLDLACGPGRIALACASTFDQVLAVDIEPEMIAVGRRTGEEQGLVNVSWQCGRAEDIELTARSIDLITIGEAFHRLDQGAILARSSNWLKSGGVIATMGGGSILDGVVPWQRVVLRVAQTWTREAMPTGWALGRQGSLSEPSDLAMLFAQHHFESADYQFVEEREWTIDEIVGYLRSTSVCSPSVLGQRRADFEADLRDSLLALNSNGIFHDTVEFGLTVARRSHLDEISDVRFSDEVTDTNRSLC